MDNIPAPKDTLLRVHITHSKPVEVSDFVSSLTAINKTYTAFVQKKKNVAADLTKSKLYVEKVEEGSIIVYLKEIVTATIIPFLENINPIFEFASYLKDAYNFFKLGEGTKPKLDLQECENLSRILDVVASDPKAEMTIGAIDCNNAKIEFNNCSFNFGESNGMQKQLMQEAEAIRETSKADNIYERVLMVIYQVRAKTDTDTSKGNKAIVDEIAKGKKVPIIFDSDELKNKILYSDDNPTRYAYQVDISVETLNGNPIAYKITALHDMFPMDTE